MAATANEETGNLPVRQGGGVRAQVPESALHSLLPHLLRLLRREPALAITLAYLLVAMAGIFYNYRFYAKFDIPVLGLSQIGDFLTAGIQHPLALVLVLSTFPIIWFFDRLNVRMRRKYRQLVEALRVRETLSWRERLRLRWLDWQLTSSNHMWVLQATYFFVIVLYGWNFVTIYASFQARQARSGTAAQVRVRLNGSEADLAASRSSTWTYLGAVSNYVFVYDAAAKQSLILPTNNVTRIEPVRPSARAGAAKAEAEKADPAGEVAPKP
ncbi:MAG: hypothetical protein JSS42_03635 [Proteobacteria bacterium]|uniref:hypothetical protein n=1 Tax=Rudaea sp. TaxID=2136325 RepID=UPI0032209671|nr:hypothetical protein [Pseudomonadota bacterium]